MAADLRVLLEQLDDAIDVAIAAIPWADRDGNRVVWAENVDTGWVPSDRADVSELLGCCVEIRMSDVDAGWFVHPRSWTDDDPFVPRQIQGFGACLAVGSDGGGGWLVVGGDGEVVHLPPGAIHDGVYERADEAPLKVVAASIREFVEFLLDRARAAGDECVVE